MPEKLRTQNAEGNSHQSLRSPRMTADTSLSDSRPLIDVTPETLVFELFPNKQAGCPLHVGNSSDVTIAFKVKTTEPRRYLVRPNQGLVPARETTSISVYLIEKDANELLQAPASLASVADKFLVQTVALNNQEAAALNASSPSNQHPDELSKFWGNIAKSAIRNKKLGVKIKVSSDAGELLAPSTPGKGVASSPSRTSKINASSPTPSPSMSTSSRSSPAGGGRYTTDRGGRSAGRAATGAAGTRSRVLDVDARVLANKYEDLVNYTANLTEERDELNQALEEAKKALQREMAARIALESKGQLQQGRKGSGSLRGTGGSRATSHLHQQSAGGFGLVTLTLVALVFFLLGHWLDLTSVDKGAAAGDINRISTTSIPKAVHGAVDATGAVLKEMSSAQGVRGEDGMDKATGDSNSAFPDLFRSG